MAAVELRAGAELRAVDGGRRLEGYAACFQVETRIGTGANAFREVIRPSAFNRSLASGRDILALCDHDATRVIARESNSSLRLHTDSRGLGFSLDLPRTTLGADLRAAAEARLLGGMSFAFRVPAPGGDAWPAADLRELLDVDLEEISVVAAHPAYPQTEVHVRSRQAHQVPAAILRRRRLLVLM